MKQIILKFSAAVIAALLFVPAINAQEDKVKEKEAPRKDVEHITITRKGDKNEKVTVVIEGDKITVNGKDIKDLKDGDITVSKSKLRSMNNLSGMQVPGAYAFGQGDGAWNLFSGDENRAMLGVVTEKTDAGVKVLEVTKESAAEKAGLKEGDIITKIGDTKVEDPDGLAEAVKKNKPGDKVAVTYQRDKKENKATAELTKWKGVSGYAFTPGQNWDNFKIPEMNFREMEIPRVQGMPRARAYNDAFGFYNGGQPKLGLSVQDTDDGKGVKVLEVDKESNAAKAGVKENDIISHVNDKEVNSADEVAKLVKENKDKGSLRLQIKRDGKSQNIEVKMPKKLKTADL